MNYQVLKNDKKNKIQVVGLIMHGNDNYVENIYLEQMIGEEKLHLSVTGLAMGLDWGLNTRTVWVVDAVWGLPPKAFETSQEAAEEVFNRRHLFIEEYWSE